MISIKQLVRDVNQASVNKRGGKVAVFREMISLSLGRSRLGVSEYFEFEIFNDNLYSPEEKRRCVGWRGSQKIDQALNQNNSRVLANDKVITYSLLKHYGFPVPETISILSPSGRRTGNEKSFVEADDFVKYITELDIYPLFLKPIHGTYGRGSYAIYGYDKNNDSFIGKNKENISRADVLEQCRIEPYKGMLLQKMLVPHPQLVTCVGTTTSCIRVIVMLTDSGPKVRMAFWKIAKSSNITDNFSHGKTGNMLAWVDIKSGVVTRLITGLWPDGEEISQHPDTGQDILHMELPDWRDAINICLDAARHFPGLRLQHWDVALCEHGPVLMELNTEADLGIPQALGREPFINNDILAMGFKV